MTNTSDTVVNRALDLRKHPLCINMSKLSSITAINQLIQTV